MTQALPGSPEQRLIKHHASRPQAEIPAYGPSVVLDSDGADALDGLNQNREMGSHRVVVGDISERGGGTNHDGIRPDLYTPEFFEVLEAEQSRRSREAMFEVHDEIGSSRQNRG